MDGLIQLALRTRRQQTIERASKRLRRADESYIPADDHDRIARETRETIAMTNKEYQERLRAHSQYPIHSK